MSIPAIESLRTAVTAAEAATGPSTAQAWEAANALAPAAIAAAQAVVSPLRTRAESAITSIVRGVMMPAGEMHPNYRGDEAVRVALSQSLVLHTLDDRFNPSIDSQSKGEQSADTLAKIDSALARVEDETAIVERLEESAAVLAA